MFVNNQRTGRKPLNNNNNTFRRNFKQSGAPAQPRNKNSQRSFPKKFIKNGQGSFPKKFTKTNNRDAIIQRNLAHMEQVAQKKRVAQEIYYSNKVANRSPLIKTPSGLFLKEENRGSVQYRLGNNRANKPQFRVNNTVINKSAKFNQQLQFNGRLRSDKIARVGQLQQKKMRFNRGPNQLARTINRGRQAGFQYQAKPISYTVRVDNSTFNSNLNPHLQQEIQMIQSRRHMSHVPPPLPPPIPMSVQMDRLPISAATTRTLHERFSVM